MPPLTRAAELRELGYQAYRAGNFARARKHFAAALDLFLQGGGAADLATAHSDLAVAAAALGDHATAVLHHEKTLALRLDGPRAALAATLHNLGVTLRDLGHFAASEARHAEALRACDAAPAETGGTRLRIVASLGTLARMRGDTAQALAHHGEALRLHQAAAQPLLAGLVDAHEDLAADYATAGDHARAAAHLRHAVSLLERAGRAASPRSASLHYNLGTVCLNTNDPAACVAHFEAALRAAPGMVAARHKLAVVLARLGRTDAASRHRAQALARQNVFVQPATGPDAVRVLILSGADDGNIPLEHVLPERDVTRIWWFPAHGAAVQSPATLPPHDVVLNGIGDADMAAATNAPIAAFLRRTGRTVLNHPARVERTRRDRLADTLGGIVGCVLPPALRLDGSAGETAIRRAAGFSLPILVRPAGAHGGAGLLRVEDWAALRLPQNAAYVTPFVEYRSADGYFRKYRVIYVDGVPFPYHLAISPDWLVHYFSADMQAHSWKLQEEARFLADWRAALGPVAATAIADIGQRLALAYCGIDFSVLPDGRALVFEANATMLVHPEAPDGVLAYKNPAVEQIVSAMTHMLRARAADQGVMLNTGP